MYESDDIISYLFATYGDGKARAGALATAPPKASDSVLCTAPLARPRTRPPPPP